MGDSVYRVKYANAEVLIETTRDKIEAYYEQLQTWIEVCSWDEPSDSELARLLQEGDFIRMLCEHPGCFEAADGADDRHCQEHWTVFSREDPVEGLGTFDTVHLTKAIA